MPTVHLIISGKVQGVFYRATAKKTADKYNITGWVQNTPDGNVEMVASGLQSDLDKFIGWCKQGPSGARVSDVVQEERGEESFTEFIIQRR